MKVFLSAVAMALAVTGCAWEGTKVEPAKVAAFKFGVTTEDDIVEALGSPTNEVTLPFGTRLLDYYHLRSMPDIAMFLPVLGPFLGGDNIETESHVFKIGQDRKLVDILEHTSQLQGNFVEDQN